MGKLSVAYQLIFQSPLAMHQATRDPFPWLVPLIRSFYAVNQSPFPLPPTVAQGGYPVVAPQMYPSSPSLPKPDIEVGEKATCKVPLQDMQNIPPPTL